MINVPLDIIPNQSLEMRLDNNRYALTLKETNGCMSVTISRNDVEILSNSRCVAGAPLIPYAYLEAGNFAFITENDDLPYYTKFNSSQTLVYATIAELAALRA